eukprot:Blabericola_migrator_1__11127@NODE_650_length_7055_cov_154_878363_g476_i0_p4_GENE_NODE_650_length_7055_cov_154_878363_g476_i0NODE_650_length_7055_cov_154_878363_g476_i0_p4_ORF_typecomplete_len199_score34_88_NODE_650_length_7055_cov_154_878363_g476_i037474343
MTMTSVHFVLCVFSAAGHVNPMVQFARYLTERREWQPDTYVTLAIQLEAKTRPKLRLPRENDRLKLILIETVDFDQWIQKHEELAKSDGAYIAERLGESVWPPVTAVITDFASGVGEIVAKNLDVDMYTFMASPLLCVHTLSHHRQMTELEEQGKKSFNVPGLGAFRLGRPDQNERMKTVMSSFIEIQVFHANLAFHS